MDYVKLKTGETKVSFVALAIVFAIHIVCNPSTFKGNSSYLNMFNPLAILEMKQDWPIQAQLWSETIQYPGALRRRPLAFSKAQRKQHDSVILHYANPKD